MARDTDKSVGELQKQVTDVVDLGGVDARMPQHALEREFDDLLALPHDVGIGVPGMQHVERRETVDAFAMVAGSQVVGRHNSTTSPGLKSGL